MAGLIDIGTSLLPIVNRVLDLIPDPAAKQKAQLEMQSKLLEIASAEGAAQAEINKVEAANTNLFVSGWRPAIGWVCASGFAWVYLFCPILTWFTVLIGLQVTFPTIDNGLMELTMGMLGMGALRSFDKWKGTAK